MVLGKWFPLIAAGGRRRPPCRPAPGVPGAARGATGAAARSFRARGRPGTRAWRTQVEEPAPATHPQPVPRTKACRPPPKPATEGDRAGSGPVAASRPGRPRASWGRPTGGTPARRPCGRPRPGRPRPRRPRRAAPIIISIIIIIKIIHIICTTIIIIIRLTTTLLNKTLMFDVCHLLIFIVAQPYALVEVSLQGVRLCGIGAGRKYPNINQRIRT